MKQLVAVMAASLMFATACDVFVPAGELDALRARESKVYVLKNDLEVEGKKLAKGEDVRIRITTGSDWIKVRAYPAKADELKADYVLLLFVFDDEFKNNKYNVAYFNERLGALLAEKGGAPVIKKK